MVNSAVRVIVRVKETPMRAIIDTGANVSIVTLLVVKKLRMINSNDLTSIWYFHDQTKKNVISIVRDASLSILDARVSINLLVIEASEDNLLLGTDWIDRYQADLSFHKRELRF